VGVVIVTFLLTRALPGDPAAYFAGPAATKEAIEQIRVNLGLDKPLIVQFGRYVGDLTRGDLGNSLTTGQPVGKEIRERLPASAELTLLGLILSISIAVRLASWQRHGLARSSIMPVACWRPPACRCRCSSPVSSWFTSSTICSVGRRHRSAGLTFFTARHRSDRLLSDRQRDCRRRKRCFSQASNN